jgi:hypothetical protein
MIIRSPHDIEQLTLEYGFLPFFSGNLDGFSIEELTPDDLWFSDVTDGPWEWKGPVIAMGSVAYGKFFQKKAGFVSLEWLPDLINYRRSQFQLSQYATEQNVYDLLVEHEAMLSTELKRLAGYVATRKPKVNPIISAFEKSHSVKSSRKSGSSIKSSFDAVITRLQMSLYVITADFEYNYTKDGKRYGWGKALYTIPELMYGPQITATKNTPEESFERIYNHLQKKFPNVPGDLLRRFII